ncbi:bifunctional alpha/beta hydrolase/OsmC family protein [Corynebacterium ciconiae]|uniref:bifunctional alpha/beta hydrolase/OsmC family protein n=1 Tax=Corynebacterium ciconiae TaxID=227319 RepID=UPI00036F9028|nr:alpha/beta fold hydrolase [Corynebacterium ciconiae]
MHSVSVKLPSSTGSLMAGTIDFPDGTPRAFAMFAHCFTGSRFTPAASRVSKTLADEGIACLRFDFPGLGQSEGEFARTSFSSNVADIRAAYDWLEEHYEAPQLMVGHSLGGAAALRAVAANGIERMKSIKAVATLGAPFDPAHAVLHFADRIGEVDEHGAVTLKLGGRDITISREFLEDLAEVNPESYLHRLKVPLLLLHSPVDQTVGIDNAQKIFLCARYPKSLVALDKVDHLATRPGAAQRAAHLISTWVRPYLQSTADSEAEDILPEGVAEAQSIPAGKFTDLVHTGSRSFTTDREKERGGKDLGIAPTSLLIAALAAATSEEIRAAAREGRIRELDDVRVSVTKVVGADSEQPVLRRKIALIGDLSDEQRAELLAARDNSPVSAMLSHVRIEDRDE